LRRSSDGYVGLLFVVAGLVVAAIKLI